MWKFGPVQNGMCAELRNLCAVETYYCAKLANSRAFETLFCAKQAKNCAFCPIQQKRHLLESKLGFR